MMDRRVGFVAVIGFAVLARIALAGPIPEHATQLPFGEGWQCMRGYSRSGDHCKQVIPPSHASLDAFGHGWACNRGYYQRDEQCLKVIPPKNAELDPYGHDWQCVRGYYKSGDICRKVDIPIHAQLNVYGSGWQCNQGYMKSNGECLKNNVPSNATMDMFGGSWHCNPGYLRNGNACVKVDVPKHGQFVPYGVGWVCENHYKKIGSACIQMSASEIRAQEEKIQAIMAAMQRRKAQVMAQGNCQQEYKTNANVCVRVVDADLDCHKSFTGNYYSDCDATANYEVNTDYEGGGSIDTEVVCELNITYSGRQIYSVQSDSDSSDETYTLQASDGQSDSRDFNFSFSPFSEVNKVRITSVNCDIESVDLE